MLDATGITILTFTLQSTPAEFSVTSFRFTILDSSSRFKVGNVPTMISFLKMKIRRREPRLCRRPDADGNSHGSASWVR
jgi:hypothetical protein